MLADKQMEALLEAASVTLAEVETSSDARIKRLMVKSALDMVRRGLALSEHTNAARQKLQTAAHASDDAALRSALRKPRAYSNREVAEATLNLALLQAHIHKPRNLTDQEKSQLGLRED